jgi:hypothetical protein
MVIAHILYRSYTQEHISSLRASPTSDLIPLPVPLHQYLRVGSRASSSFIHTLSSSSSTQSFKALTLHSFFNLDIVLRPALLTILFILPPYQHAVSHTHTHLTHYTLIPAVKTPT